MKKFLSNIFGTTEDGQTENRGNIEKNLQVATAALLIEIAGVDEEFTAAERREIVDNLKRYFSLSDNEVDEILEITAAEIEQRLDLYHFTRQLNSHYDIDRKMKIMEMVWRVIYSDKHLHGREDLLVHRFARLLNLEHGQLIETKLRVKDEIDRSAH